MAAFVLYITHARKPVERIECETFGEAQEAISEAFMHDPTVMGYGYAGQPSWEVSMWFCYWFDKKGRQSRPFDPVNLPKDIKAMRLIGL